MLPLQSLVTFKQMLTPSHGSLQLSIQRRLKRVFYKTFYVFKAFRKKKTHTIKIGRVHCKRGTAVGLYCYSEYHTHDIVHFLISSFTYKTSKTKCFEGISKKTPHPIKIGTVLCKRWTTIGYSNSVIPYMVNILNQFIND